MTAHLEQGSDEGAASSVLLPALEDAAELCTGGAPTVSQAGELKATTLGDLADAELTLGDLASLTLGDLASLRPRG